MADVVCVVKGILRCKCGIVITHHDSSEFRHKVNEVFNKINKWFHSNLLTLNYDKTFFFPI